ncbi:hypothetical protein C6499_12440 [Candidatus Poribacteria bacterium]|nr:MAG: hypothetical protein C6499_12440 [Candidatus Poribacteria bacterium]
MLVKFLITVTVLFLSPLSVFAGTFLETFDDKALEGWQQIWVDKGPAVWEIVDDELHAESREAYIHLLTTGDTTWENYTMEFDVKPLKKHGIGGISIAVRVDRTWFVSCNISDPVIIRGDDPPVQEERISCGATGLHRPLPPRAILIDELHPLLRLNRWAHLKLSVEGNIFTFWLNGEQIMAPTKLLIFRQIEVFANANFPDFQTGGVGFGLWNYTAIFDNITVTGDSVPNGGDFDVTSQGKLATTWGNLKEF